MRRNSDKLLEVILIFVIVWAISEWVYVFFPRYFCLDLFFHNHKKIDVKSSSVVKKQVLKKSDIQEKKEEHKEENNSRDDGFLLPDFFDIDIPFICQAPLGDWGAPFDHACEEASILMIHYYLEGKSVVNPVKAAKEIQEIVRFEQKTYGFYKDTTAEQTAQLIRDYYGYKTKVSCNISLDDIKRELIKGNLVIVPTAGRLLGNPYFTPPGPIYHMLVIRGYTLTEIITNDPGTRRGNEFSYSYQTLEKAIHNWNGKEMSERTIEGGEPVMIVIYPHNDSN